MKKTIAVLFIGISLLVIATHASAVQCHLDNPPDCSDWGGDSDGDYVCNDWEDYWYGTDKYDPDDDNGGVCDGQELFADSTDPLYLGDDLIA